jgi:opacity protein-like surface antigen
MPIVNSALSKLLVCSFISGLIPAGLWAADAPPRFEFTAMAGAATGGNIDAEDDLNSLDAGDGTLAGAILHVTSPAGGQFEFAYWRDDTDLKAPGLFTNAPGFDVTIEYLQIGGTYPSTWSDGFHPYIVATIGAARFDPDNRSLSDETVFAGTAGGGMRFNVSPRLALKLEGRAFVSFFDSNSNIFCASTGGSAGCAIRASGDLVTRWTALAGVAYRF